MLTPSVVTIVVNGTVVAGAAPARVRDGRVVAPVAPVLIRLASSVAYDSRSGTVVVERGARRIVVAVAFITDDVPYVELGPVVRDLGGRATFDPLTKTLTVNLADDDSIGTPAPFDPRRPQVVPTAVFTPAPPRPTPHATETGVPHPRRTAIPAAPSQPVGPQTPPATSPRR